MQLNWLVQNTPPSPKEKKNRKTENTLRIKKEETPHKWLASHSDFNFHLITLQFSIFVHHLET